MKRRLTTLLIGLGLAVLFLMAAAGPVQAALGESVDSVASDQTALAAKRVSQMVGNGYTVQELRSDSVTLREYVAPTGIVFAIAWNGLIHPDLTSLLGSYVGEYRTALQHVPRRTRQQAPQSRDGPDCRGKMGTDAESSGAGLRPCLNSFRGEHR